MSRLFDLSTFASKPAQPPSPGDSPPHRPLAIRTTSSTNYATAAAESRRASFATSSPTYNNADHTSSGMTAGVPEHSPSEQREVALQPRQPDVAPANTADTYSTTLATHTEGQSHKRASVVSLARPTDSLHQDETEPASTWRPKGLGRMQSWSEQDYKRSIHQRLMDVGETEGVKAAGYSEALPDEE